MLIPIESLMVFIVASALLSLAPGPDNIFVLSQSALYGFKSGVLIILGLCTGLLLHTTAVAVGVAVIFQTSIIAFFILKMIGAIYLLFLAWCAFLVKKTETGAIQVSHLSKIALYCRGIIMNATNPKVSIFFLAFLPQFASPKNGALMPQFFVLGFLFLVVAFVIFSVIAALAGFLGQWLRQSPVVYLYLNRIAGSVFVILALHLFLSGSDSGWH